jgi:hypothetical protein
MFGGWLVVGLRALAPVERARRRQLEFTADASHEPRTPLSVIRTEADVALSSPREAAEYREALARIQGESRRLRPVDLVTLAQACADRFRAVGPAISTEAGPELALISAPPEWIDRPAGGLMDNACRYAGAGAGRSGSGSAPAAAGSASPWRTAGPASPKQTGHTRSSGFTASPSTGPAPAWDSPSATRSCARPVDAGTSATRRWPERSSRCHGGIPSRTGPPSSGRRPESA